MITLEELGQRLRQARERAGIKQDEAASNLNLDATAIAKIEHGKRGVGALELVRLAALYKISVNDLLLEANQRGTEEVQLRVALRAGVALDSKTMAMQHRLQQIISDDRWLRQQLGESDISLPWNSLAQNLPTSLSAHERGYQGAALFRQRFNLTASPIANMEVLADEIGVLVSRLPLDDHQAPDGCSAIDPLNGTAYILINSDKPRVRRRFTIAHELGHLALGHLQGGEIALDETINASPPSETEANTFAAELLMPEAGIKAALARLQFRLGVQAKPIDYAVWLAASLGVSEEALAYRMLNLGLFEPLASDSGEVIKIAKERPDLIKQIRARLGLSPVMSDSERGITEVGPAMRSRIALALEKGLISIQRASQMLNVPISEAYRWIVETGLKVMHSNS